MKNLIAILALTLAFLSSGAFAGERVFNSSGTQIGIFADMKFANGLAVNQVGGKAQVSLASGDGTAAMAGFLKPQISVSGNLTAAQCGSTITNDVTGGNAPVYTLPTISPAILGCRFTFIVGTSSGSAFLTVTPDLTHKVLTINSNAGRSVSASVQGNALEIEAIAPGWAPTGAVNGTWFAN